MTIGDLATDEGADAVAATAGEVDILVNNAVAYLAGPYADYVSGATLRVDGGTVRSVI